MSHDNAFRQCVQSHDNAWSHGTQYCTHIAHNIHSFIHSLISMRLQISPYLFSFLQHLKRAKARLVVPSRCEIFNNIQLISLMKSGFGHATSRDNTRHVKLRSVTRHTTLRSVTRHCEHTSITNSP